MTTIEHSPGPWFMEAEAYDSYYQISDDFGTTLAQVEAWDAEDDEEITGQAKANARLIAAAPDLLELAEQIVLAKDTDESIPVDIYNAAVRIIAKTKAA